MFEKFEIFRGECFMTITKAGSLTLSVGAQERFNVQDGDKVTLYFDRESRRIGIRFNEGENYSAVITKGANAQMSAIRFCREYGIPLGVTTTRLHIHKADGMIVTEPVPGKCSSS